MQTPIRDELGLNDADTLASMGVAAASKRAEQSRMSALRSELRAGLSTLPAPQNDYQVVAPDLPNDDMDIDDDALEEDAADIKARRAKMEEERRVAEEKRKSTALQRGLPRPVSLSLLPPGPAPSEVPKLSLRERSEALLAEEYARRLTYDTRKHPLPPQGKETKEAKKAAKAAAAAAASLPPLDDYQPTEIEAAGKLLAAEIVNVKAAMGHSSTGVDEYMEAYLLADKELMWLPSKGACVRFASATPAEKVESTKAAYEWTRSEMEAEAKRASKLEQKVGVLLTGLQQREGKMRKQVEEQWDAVQQAKSELECFKALHEREQQAAPERIEHMLELVKAQQEREKALQDRYKGLMRERQDILDARA